MTVRRKRLGDQIHRALASLMSTALTDPVLKTLTITAVDVAPDLSNAKVYFVAHDDEIKKELERALKHAGNYLRKSLATELNMRVTPRLNFHYDESFAHGQRIETLLEGIEE